MKKTAAIIVLVILALGAECFAESLDTLDQRHHGHSGNGTRSGKGNCGAFNVGADMGLDI